MNKTFIHDNKLYNLIFLAVLILICLILVLYFLNFLEPIGLRYQPEPLPPPTIETAPSPGE